MKTKLLAFLLALAMIFALAGCGTQQTEEPAQTPTSAPAVEDTAEPAAEPAGEDVFVLYTNDAHCGVNDGVGYTGLAAVKNALESQGKTVLLVDNGDAIQGDTIGTLSKGEYIIDIMNEIGYDVAIPGNHEFDYGMEQFLSLTEAAEFPYVSANFLYEGEGVLEPYTILEAGGMKIAFVGISTPKTVTTSTPAYFQNEAGEFVYTFCQDETGEALYTAVQEAVDAARAEGAQVVVALAHLGIELDCSPWTSSEVINNTSGIDVMLDGHSHSVIPGEVVQNKDGQDVILTSTGTKLENIGCLTIHGDGTFSTALISDGGMGAFIEGIQAEFEELVNEVVAVTDVDLVINDPQQPDVRIIRTQETNLGDLCADAYRFISGADVAIVNGGGIRSAIPAGDITYGQIIAVHPFGNELCVVEATGQEILDALELGASQLPGESGGFLHVSGMTYTVDLSVESSVLLDENGMFQGVEGEYRVKDVTIGGEPLDLEATYTLASHNYKLKDCGDGYTMFQDNVFLQDSVMLDNQVLINYIIDGLGGIVGEEYADPYGQGRITILPAA